MATNISRKYGRNISTRSEILTVAANQNWAINNMNMTNAGGSAITIQIEADMYTGGTPDTLILRKDWTIPAGETRSFDGVLVLTDGDKLFMESDLATLHAVVSYQTVDV